MIRVLPQHIKQYRLAVGSPKKDQEPYVQLSARDTNALQQLSAAILDQSADSSKKFAYPGLSVERNKLPSTFVELREAVGAICRSSEIFSLTEGLDKTETYAALAFKCSAGPIFIGVALQSGKPIRAYLEETEVVSAPLPASQHTEGK